MNDTDTSINQFPPPPPGFNYLAAIEASVNVLIIGTVWSSMLVPLLIALFVFSTKDLRRKPVFAMSVVAILLGLVEGAINLYAEVQNMVHPLNPPSVSYDMAFGVIVWIIPFYVELILLLRLLAVYPPSSTSWLRTIIVFGPLAALKIGRLVNISITYTSITRIQRDNPGLSPIANSQLTWQKVSGAKIEWIFQVLDNVYSSILFLWRLKEGRRFASHEHSTYGHKIKTLFWISVSNFVFPCLLSLAQLIFLFVDNNALHASYIVMTNNYVQIVGVLLATVWASGSNWTESRSRNVSTTILSSVRFKRGANRTFTSSATTSTALADLERSHVPVDPENIQLGDLRNSETDTNRDLTMDSKAGLRTDYNDVIVT